MARYARVVEELLDFLLTRLDEAGFAQLVVHEPKRLYAAYIHSDGGRVESRGVAFTGCVTCSLPQPSSDSARRPAVWFLGETVPSGYRMDQFGGYSDINIEEWPCLQVRTLTLPFADDPDYCDWWRPEVAVFVSGKLVHQEPLDRARDESA